MKARSQLAAAVALLLCVAAASAEHPFADRLVSVLPPDVSNEAIVYTESGPVVGVVNETASLFLGIPYANPPVNAYRWANAVPAQPWTDFLNCTEFAVGCPQSCDLPPLTCPVGQDESCLYLNVFRPRRQPSDPLVPVMFFIHGGNFQQGAAGTLLYDGEQIANETNTVVVVINYRLGALGFLILDELQGNYGFRDQQFALQWVQRNIAQFGGDPNHVTIFGQSAGGTSTTAHMISQQSFGLYHRVITESNPVGLNLNTYEKQVKASQVFVNSAGCGGYKGGYLTQCLRNLTIAQILAAQAVVDISVDPSAPIGIFYPWTPTIDGDLIQGQPVNLFPKGLFNQVPLMIGTVLDEAWLFIWQVQPLPIPSPEYVAILGALFHENANDVLKLYPVGPFEKDTRPQLNQVITDYLFLCPTRWLARSALSNYPSMPLYKYYYTHIDSFYEGWGPDYKFCWFDYVCHGSELPFVFQSVALGGFSYTPEEEHLTLEMVKYWGNFAHTGNPNVGPGGVPDFEWPLYDNEQMRNIKLNLTISEISAIKSDYCDYWDSIGYFQA